MTLKVVSWNVNSIRSRLEHVLSFLVNEEPDILMLQETKCEDEQFPDEAFADLPYNISKSGQKSYNGVAILSKLLIDEVKVIFPKNPCEEQARFIEVACQTSIGYSRIISVYVPNGSEVGSEKFTTKLEFYDALTEYLVSIRSSDEHLIVGGDFNVAPFDIDVYSTEALENALCFTQMEKQKMRALLNQGFEDLYRLYAPSEHGFSWWDYRGGSLQRDLGIRIDMILAGAHTANLLSSCYVAKAYRELDKASDHAPVVAIFAC